MDAFRHTAAYDVAVATWLGATVAPGDATDGMPGWLAASGSAPECCATARTRTNPRRCTSANTL